LNDFAASLYAFVAYITHGSLNQGADFVLRLVTESTAALTTGDGCGNYRHSTPSLVTRFLFNLARLLRRAWRLRGGIRFSIHLGQCFRQAILLGLQVRHLIILIPFTRPSGEIAVRNFALVAPTISVSPLLTMWLTTGELREQGKQLHDIGTRLHQRQRRIAIL
jgi:hypothetical protein